MSAPHHGGRNPEEQRLRERLLDQFLGVPQREWSHGRIGAEDDGDLAFAIATDKEHQTIVIRFGKPVEWIGLDRKAAEELRDQLTARLHELRGIVV